MESPREEFDTGSERVRNSVFFYNFVNRENVNYAK